MVIELLMPREAQAMYEERFSVDHSIRFMKGDLGLTCGQFNSTEAEGRVQVWVEMVATAFWLWAANSRRRNLNSRRDSRRPSIIVAAGVSFLPQPLPLISGI